MGARGLAGLVLPSRRLCPLEGRPERWEREVSSSPGQHPASSPSAEAGGHGLPWVCRSGRDQNVFRDADSDSPRRRVAVLAHRVAKVGQATMETFLARADRNLLMIVRTVTIFTAFPIGPWHSAQKRTRSESWAAPPCLPGTPGQGRWEPAGVLGRGLGPRTQTSLRPLPGRWRQHPWAV